MKNISPIFSLLFLLLFSFVSYGQLPIDFSAINDGATINTCNGFIIDSGGQGGPGYSDNENTTITICPDTPGEIISIVFNLFDLNTSDDNPGPQTNVDYMYVYDGDNTGANSLGVYSGNGLQGVVIQATVLNPTGCITLTFTSNTIGSGASSGTGMFSASVACETPCSDPQAGAVIVGGITPDSIRVCTGDIVNFQEQGSFAQPGFSLVSFDWDFMDGSSANGTSVSHFWTTPGMYRVQLFVTDDNGCSNPNLVDLVVLVGTIPDFTGFPGDTTICLGESANFVADPVSYQVEWDGFPGSASVDDGCLPDTLLGVSQDIQLLQTGFSAGSTIMNVNDIQSICLELEHSYMGDLVIILECPNGQNVIMHQQGGGGTQLGVPIQADNVDCSDPATMGVPFNYCFTPSATETWVEWVTANGGGTLPAGNYESVDPLSNLVGCPTNGVWTLTVIDNWAADDGTIFSFGLTLDPSYYPSITTFEPQIGTQCDSSYWDTPQFLTSISGDCNDITVTPTSAGSFTYEYYVSDDFGCTYDTSLVLTVTPNPTVFAGNDTTLCNGTGLQLNGQISGVTATCDYVLSLDDTFGDGWNGNTITVTINGTPTTYTLTTGSNQIINLQIPTGATVTVTFNAIGSWVDEVFYSIVDDTGNSIVSQGPNLVGGETDTFNANCIPDYVYEWTPAASVSDPTILDPNMIVNGQQTLTLLTYPIGHPLCASSDDIVVSISATPDPGVDALLEVCSSGATEDLFPLLGPTASPNGTWVDPSGNPMVMPYDPQTMPVGIYVYIVDSNGCIDQATVTITEIITDITNFTTTAALCFGSSDGTATITGNNIDNYTIDGGAPIPTVSPFTINGLSAGTYTIVVYSLDGCSATEDVIVGEPLLLVSSSIVTNASCFGVCDGEVQVTPTDGTSPYTYAWQGGANGGQNGFATGICAGNYSVDITDANGCQVTEQYIITEPAAVTPSILGDTLEGCFPHQVDFINTTQSANIVTTTVDFGDGSIEVFNGLNAFEHTYDYPGLYTVTVTLVNTSGCIYVITYDDLITVHDNPNANFYVNPANVSMLEPVANLTNSSSNDVISWSWVITNGTPESSTSENVNGVTYPFDSPGLFPVTLTVVNEWGCTDSILKYVTIVSDIIVYAPNTFTPDDDEFNQDWFMHVSGIDIYDFDLFIYNRWGEVVWESHDPSVAWDGTYKGKVVQDGTYTWIMKCADILNDDKYTFNGHISIIR